MYGKVLRSMLDDTIFYFFKRKDIQSSIFLKKAYLSRI